ncbi:MAG: 2-oxo acid dehydrogenase subunit E2 [Spirochaetales bacterium]|nr:2-oxo acid dehydrogenase subunit E2 [Spirochaetales bacterium]
MAEKVFMIALSPTMEEGAILKWQKKVGDAVKMDDILCEVETDKASMEYVSSQEGVLLAIVKDVGASAKVGDTIAVIGEAGEDPAPLIAESAPSAKPPTSTQASASTPAPASAPVVTADTSTNGRTKSSPLARRIAAEKGLNVAEIPGSGPGGRVVKADVEGYTPAPAVKTSVPASSPLNNDRVPVSRKRGTIAKRLSESLFTAPHFFLTLGIEMDGLLAAREKLNEKRKDKLGLNAFLIKFLAEALKRHQALNASWEGDYIQNHASVDIAIAVAQPDGLITPVVRDCGSKGVLQIETELRDLIDRARNNQLKPDDYSGATFTISNLGSFGIEEFTAIINPPGAAILALGATIKTPVVAEDDSIVVKKIMKVTLSCDHRVIDGAVGAAFLTEFKGMVEDPYRVLL